MFRKRGSGCVLTAIGDYLGGRGWRRGPVPEALAEQAQAGVAVAALAARFFRRPTEANAFAVHQARLRARREALAAAAALKAGRDLRRREWLALSRRLAQAAEEGAAGAAEGSRFGVAGVPDLPAMSAGLRDAGRDLVAALAALPDAPRCEARLIAAKRRAAEVERLRQRARAAALDGPNVVTELKLRTVLQRLSRAAEALQQAADGVAEMLESMA